MREFGETRIVVGDHQFPRGVRYSLVGSVFGGCSTAVVFWAMFQILQQS